MTADGSPRIHFTSELPASHRDRLEALLFFNENQPGYRDVIVESIERFGEPRVRDEKGLLRMHTRLLGEVQALYAVEGRDADEGPIAAAVYARTARDTITLLHIAVDARYAAGGRLADRLVSLRLIGEVVKSVSRIKGIEKVEMLYAAGGDVRTRVRMRAAEKR